MGYTPAGGIPMGTRSGYLDPGVMLELAARFDPLSLRDIVFHQMGLLALSDGESSDMNDLLASTSEAAQFAVTYFCQQISSAIGSFAARAGGIDGLVFTGGIGENSALIRQKICRPLEFMGFTLDDATNQSGNLRISSTASHPILVIRADEEQHIATLCQKFLV